MRLPRSSLIIVALAGLALLVASCASGDSVFSLSVGDCFNAPETEEASRVEVLPCDAAHDHEVFLLFDLPDGDFPSAGSLGELSGDGCLAGFDSYVGAEYADSTLGVNFVPPSEDTWDDGDREVICYVYLFTGGQLIAPVQDSGL